MRVKSELEKTTVQTRCVRVIVLTVLANMLLPASARPNECQAANLVEKYARMRRDDQALRGKYIQILEREAAQGRVDQTVKEKLERTISETDERNRIALDRLLSTCGWPKRLDANRAALSAFLIIQHAPLPYQLRYFPMVASANRRGEISNEHLAWLIDRVLVKQGKLQRYGTEFEYGSNKVFPVEDEQNLNRRRAKMGLPPMKGFPF